MMQRCSSNGRSTFSFLFSSMSTSATDEPNSSSSSVDCTLSLGPPSSPSSVQRSSSCGAPSFSWDVIKPHPQAAATSSSSFGGSDPLLLARRCANCDTTSTPLWRNGPRGPKSLCNACGIRYKKEERRASSSTPSPASPFHHHQQQHHQQPWMASPSPTKRHEQEMEQVPSYLPWRLNVVPPPPSSLGLFHFH